ncbi:hypothetical protein [Acinetobacter larvae]|uniref:Uncharacterized protein n=1 Tax=Acinetobacter larvae TaxID=1789224 RepID=A0A1B2LVY7_9GAMM|nr:hypothetical protein [Acinetobacter larvae]AOA57112.1 hypothetical protein BFG52_01265 [Acinetobacter larvae]
MNDIQLSPEYKKLINRFDHLDLIDPFHDDYYIEMQHIHFDFAYLKAKSEREDFPIDPEPKVLTLSTHTSDEEMASLLKSLADTYSENAKAADDLETVIYSNISNYDFKAMNIKVKAQVDFLDLYFEIEKPSTRHDIKKYLTEKTGITHYISEHKKGFIIRLHDMNSWNELQRRVQHLNHFKCNKESLRIMEIELAIDFYHFKHRALVTALFKSIYLPNTAKNFRVFKSQSGVFTPVPTTPLTMMKRLESGYNIGINYKNADEYWHLYVKTTDQNKQPLSKDKWRIRAEKNIKHNVLNKMDNQLTNLKRVLLEGFKGLSFTQLMSHAPQSMKDTYRDSNQPFGMEQEIYYGKSRHKRTLREHIEKYAELNRLISSAVHNLLRNFAISA